MSKKGIKIILNFFFESFKCDRTLVQNTELCFLPLEVLFLGRMFKKCSKDNISYSAGLLNWTICLHILLFCISNVEGQISENFKIHFDILFFYFKIF